MKSSKNQFDDAFREVFKIEFNEAISACEYMDYEFSNRHKKESLVKYAPFRNMRVVKKAAVLCTVIFVAFLSCNVDAVTDSIQNFFEKSLGEADYFEFNVEELSPILYEYKLTNIPDGFILYDYQKTEAEIISVYKNSEGEIIKFTQQTLNPDGFIIEIENAEKYDVQTKGIHINIYQTESCIVGTWIKDSCLMIMSFFGSAEVEELIALIESLK